MVFSSTASPFEKQKKARDQQRIGHFSSISRDIEEYYRTNKKLPTELDDIENASGDYLPTSRDRNYLVDPQTKQKYTYKVTAEVSYQLCTTFETNTQKTDGSPDAFRIANDYYTDTTHPIGNHCITYQIPTYLRQTPVPTAYPLVNQSSGSAIDTTLAWNQLEEAKAKNDVTICEKIELYRAKYNCISEIAAMRKDTKVCDRITVPEEKNMCIIRVASETDNPQLCNTFTDKKTQDTCRLNVPSATRVPGSTR